MVVNDGKIIEATEAELFGLYLDRGYDDVCPFYEYLSQMEALGVKITGKEE